MSRDKADNKTKQITIKIDLQLNNRLRKKIFGLGFMDTGYLTPAIEGAIECMLNESDDKIKKHITDRVKDRKKLLAKE